jgi:hypothetical protein
MTSQFNLNQINAVLFSGFDYTIPDDTIKTLNYLSQQIGSNLFITDNLFHKKEYKEYKEEIVDEIMLQGFKPGDKKKRKGNKHMEITDDAWDTVRSFQATKIETKTGLDANLEKIKLILIKLTTDKNQFIKIKEQLINEINEILESDTSTNTSMLIGTTILDIALKQKKFTKMYAELYTELIILYDWLKPIVDDQLIKYFELFDNMQYYDPDTNYEKFCDMNELNDKRKSATQLFLNFSLTCVIQKTTIYDILIKLSQMMFTLINETNKKFEVDEIIENIAILFDKDILVIEKDPNFNKASNSINGQCVSELIKSFAKCKSKDYKSLSTKAIFKCMDLIEM